MIFLYLNVEENNTNEVKDSVIFFANQYLMYIVTVFNYFIYHLSQQSHNPDEEWYWFAKNITESFTSFVLYFLYVLFTLQEL